MSHPLDISAATDWIKSEVSPEFAREVGDALPSLPVGTAFVCSASLGIGQRIDIRERETFNSGATPAPGERKVEPKVLATVDIERLGREIAESAKRTLETSPEFLQKRIAELERAGKGDGRVDTGREVAELRAEIGRLKPVAERVGKLESELHRAEGIKGEIAAALRSFVARLENGNSPHIEESVIEPAIRSSKARVAVVKTEPVVPPTSDGLSTSEQKVLDALASLEAVGVETPSKTQLAAFARYSNPKSGVFAAPAAALVRKNLIESSGRKAGLTVTGRDAAHQPGQAGNK